MHWHLAEQATKQLSQYITKLYLLSFSNNFIATYLLLKIQNSLLPAK